MKFNLLLEELLDEALSPNEIYDKYYTDIPLKTFQRIIKSDPNTKLDDKGNIKKIGKYSKILLQMFKNGNLKLEDLPRATEYLTLVYKYNVALDINKITSLPEMYNQIEKYLAQEQTDFFGIVKQLSPNEYQLLYNSENWVIYTPKTERAACYLGVNTQWCTTWGKYSLDKSYRDRDNHFKRHHTQGPLYIIVNKNDTNEKYQFHFESKQYMDKSDRRIKTQDFLEKNDDIRNFFFPSLTKEVSKEQLDKEIGIIDILPDNYASVIIQKTIGPEGRDNKLVQIILNKGGDSSPEEMLSFINDGNLVNTYNGYPIEFDNNFVSFELRRVSGEIENVENVISYYESDKHNAYDRLYEDMNYNDEDNIKDYLSDILKDYYNKNQSQLKSILGIINYEQLYEHYIDSFYEVVKDDFSSAYASINAPNYESRIDESINEIQKYITITQDYSSYTVRVNLLYFVKFLIRDEITKIDNNTNQIIDDYISMYPIQTEYEYVYDYDVEYPKYDENNDITKAVDNFFDSIIDDDEEKNKGCLELRKKLNDVINNIFKGKNILDNEYVHIELPNYKIDCNDGSIIIKYLNKETNKKYEGKIKVDNLASYATNYKLFETYITYKKNIL